MGKILYAERDGVVVLKFVGDVRVTLGPTISSFLHKLGERENLKSVVIDMSETDCIDSTSLGLLAKISLTSQATADTIPTIISPKEDITRILVSMGFDEVFVIVSELVTECGQLGELPTEIVPEARLREQVIEAHKVLMGLNEQNQIEFRDLVEALENESGNSQPVPRNRIAC